MLCLVVLLHQKSHIAIYFTKKTKKRTFVKYSSHLLNSAAFVDSVNAEMFCGYVVIILILSL